MPNNGLTVPALYGGGTHVVKFSSPTCGPCRAVAGIISHIEEDDRFSDVAFWEVNVTDPANSDLVKTLNIRSVPVVVIVKDGENRKIVVGGDITEIKLEDTLLELTE
jgi:thiol-disulfide isomerase/thioredoxin